MTTHFHERVSAFFSQHFNFFRIHLTVFTFLPIIVSGIFYAANAGSTGNANAAATGVQRVEYIDSLFLCFSAMTVTGMTTVNISAARPFQQVLLFLLFICGDMSIVSLVMVLVRKHYFRIHCSQLLKNDYLRRTNTVMPEHGTPSFFSQTFTVNPASPVSKGLRRVRESRKAKDRKVSRKEISGPSDARAMGSFAPDEDKDRSRLSTDQGGGGCLASREMAESPTSLRHSRVSFRLSTTSEARVTQIDESMEGPTAQGSMDEEMLVDGQVASPAGILHVPFDEAPNKQYQARQRIRSQTRAMSLGVGPSPSTLVHPLEQTKTMPSPLPRPVGPHHSGMGGFPTPARWLPYLLPRRARSSLQRHFTRPNLERQQTILTNVHTQQVEEDGWQEMLMSNVARWMPSTLQHLVVGRNSRFFTEELDDDELEDIGGVEYRALRFLSYFVTAYIFLFQAIPFAIIAIYIAKIHSWDPVFETSLGAQSNAVDKTWFSLFVTVSAYTGTGLNLLDQSIIPLMGSYLVIYVLNVVMLAGNHALPMMLRFSIWLLTKICRTGEINETLHFLLDHPRRCFLYLFPSHQTWYLVLLLTLFMIVEVAGFFLLQIGLPVLDNDGWTLVSDAAFQSLSVRASGFNILPVSNFAPALLFLYVILMYVAIYPIAMSIRSTNVYEERSLGVYEHDDVPADEPTLQGDKREIFSKYLVWHMRRQMTSDIWPLCAAIFGICIFERGKLMDPEKETWFTIFRIIFECTSAYSTIGLSLGVPSNNYSFCGDFGTASKLIMIGVMLKGRHRGLPVAIDRAIMLPHEMARIDKKQARQASGTQTGTQNGESGASNNSNVSSNGNGDSNSNNYGVASEAAKEK